MDHECVKKYTAVMPVSSDGHAGTLKDGGGRAIPNTGYRGILLMVGGTASMNQGYLRPAIPQWKAMRTDASIPVAASSMHMYFNNIGNQGGGDGAVQCSIAFEEVMNSDTRDELSKVCVFRGRVTSDKEI